MKKTIEIKLTTNRYIYNRLYRSLEASCDRCRFHKKCNKSRYSKHGHRKENKR